MKMKAGSRVFSEWTPDAVGDQLGTGYSRFVSPAGIEGLARVSGDRLDVLAVFCRTPGRGCLGEFLRRCMARYDAVCVWEVFNPVVSAALQRRGFRRAEETDPATGETVTGWRWQRKRRRA